MWHGGFAKVGRLYRPFDVAFLPINGVIQRAEIDPVTLVEKSMMLEQAIQVALALRAKQIVPIRFMLNVTDERNQ